MAVIVVKLLLAVMFLVPILAVVPLLTVMTEKAVAAVIVVLNGCDDFPDNLDFNKRRGNLNGR